ncbi:Hypothetical_protein [Hexamita inflata]|uniref:Hypothetical_protein n=1 Tax=Hexamita inflata TaxID=28002 RepID=A0AA86PGJ7_9EUKA|nr:Hypothetical protein HINF_LOCUS24518 [Hexamita inflata]
MCLPVKTNVVITSSPKRAESTSLDNKLKVFSKINNEKILIDQLPKHHNDIISSMPNINIQRNTALKRITTSKKKKIQKELMKLDQPLQELKGISINKHRKHKQIEPLVSKHSKTKTKSNRSQSQCSPIKYEMLQLNRNCMISEPRQLDSDNHQDDISIHTCSEVEDGSDLTLE